MLTATYAVVQEGSVNPDETVLIHNARQGDLEAFNQLVLRYQDRIYNLAIRILGSPDDADDITQNTFLTAYRNLAQFRNGSFYGWLYRIATNACYDIYRNNKRHPVLSIDNNDLAEEKFEPLEISSNQSVVPEVAFTRHELEQVIQNALNQLDIDHRTVVILVDQHGFDYRQTAQILKIPVGTLKSRLARARQHLRQLLSHVLENTS